MAGYSGTPLWKKLGYKPGLSVWIENAPTGYRQLLALPDDLEIVWESRCRAGQPFAHVFVDQAATLKSRLKSLRSALAADGVVWISWPKKSSGVVTDITEDTIRSLALPLGFVDVKVCAVDTTWSGLKLMIRKSAR